jgi:hypothetical protein
MPDWLRSHRILVYQNSGILGNFVVQITQTKPCCGAQIPHGWLLHCKKTASVRENTSLSQRLPVVLRWRPVDDVSVARAAVKRRPEEQRSAITGAASFEICCCVGVNSDVSHTLSHRAL